jgi:hypothetical protein
MIKLPEARSITPSCASSPSTSRRGGRLPLLRWSGAATARDGRYHATAPPASDPAGGVSLAILRKPMLVPKLESEPTGPICRASVSVFQHRVLLPIARPPAGLLVGNEDGALASEQVAGLGHGMLPEAPAGKRPQKWAGAANPDGRFSSGWRLGAFWPEATIRRFASPAVPTSARFSPPAGIVSLQEENEPDADCDAHCDGRNASRL